MKSIIKEARISQRLTQQELADKVGCSRQYLSEIENGKNRNISSKIILKLSKVLKLKLEILLKE